MIHCPWDYGIITFEVSKILGVKFHQKTCKTLCGKRVVSNKIHPKDFDCEKCRKRYVDTTPPDMKE